MLRIAFKTFRHGRWELRSCFLGVALCVAEMFTFLAISNNLFSQTTNSLFKMAALSDILRFYFTFTAVTVLGIYYSLKSYFIRRVRDYRVMFLLGAKTSSVISLIVIEYLLGTMIAVAEGLVLGNAAFLWARYILRKTSEDAIWDKYYVGNSYKLVILLSLLTIMIVGLIYIFKYALDDIGSKLMSSDGQSYSEQIPAAHGQMVRIAAGVLLIIFSLISYRYLIVEVQYLTLPYISISIGLTMVIYPVVCILLRARLNGGQNLRRKLSLLSLFERYRTQFNRIIIIVAIDVFAMGYAAVVISDFVPVRSEAFPYDAMIMASEDGADKCESMIRQHSGISYTYPMVRITDWYNYEHIGISEDVYRQLGGECGELSSGEVVFSRQNQHANEPVIGDAERSADQYELDRYLYPGKYRQDHGWDDIMPDQNFGHIVTEHKYEIKELKLENLIGQWLVDDGNMAETLVVFSNIEFESIRKELSGLEDEPTTLILCRFPESMIHEAITAIRHSAKEFCPDDLTTEGQKSWYTANDSGDEITRYRTGGLSEMIVLLLVMGLSAAVQLIVNNLSEQTYLEHRTLFLNSLGYPERIRMSILGAQYRIVPYFSLIIAVFGAFLMRTGYIALQHTANFYNNDVSGKIWLITTMVYIIFRVITTELITIMQRRKVIKNTAI